MLIKTYRHETDGRCWLPLDGTTAQGVDAILAERQKTHGDFETHAKLAQALKDQMRTGKQWPHLNPVQREALDMIQHKIARILNGDPNHPDHWADIAGDATLVQRELGHE